MTWLLWIINFVWLCWGLWMEMNLEVRFITQSNYANVHLCLMQQWSIFLNTGPTRLILNQVRNPPRFTWQSSWELFLVCCRSATCYGMCYQCFPQMHFLHSVMFIPEVLHAGCLLWGVFLFKSASRLSIKELSWAWWRMIICWLATVIIFFFEW